MKKTDKIAYRQKEVAQLRTILADLRRKLVETRAKLHTGNLKDTSVIKKIRAEITMVLTLITENDKQKTSTISK